ncbi:hypothetical protein G3580_09925 [Nitrogeniibacter mangrovi]|uniref:Uncharacterized protein n=1 Tax=Nitrogeniibacter mangrovi TaxID=2016596 RepID=A0A6C1B4J5_9RHOO|nr:hypothetical protein [Nitrogeniibacter mangrovi]QID17929.1 hypothetical protein G3580_09925 [Nitrogeniibacter mangrovi]
MQASDRQLNELARHQLDCPVMFGSISQARDGERAEAPRPAGDDPARSSDMGRVAILSEN